MSGPASAPPHRAATWLLRMVAVAYALGAAVHAGNILGLSGIDWVQAPFKWRALDVTYLALDLVVAVGFFARWAAAFVAFYLAAASQLLLYTAFRSWILDVPAAFAIGPGAHDALDVLVAFHLVTVVLVTVAIRLTAARYTGGE